MPLQFVHRPGDDPIVDVGRWIELPALLELVELFGGAWPDGSLSDVVAGLETFSAVWDRRGGQTRLNIEQIEDERLGPRVLELAEDLGLVEPAPPVGGVYEWMLILGGLATGCRPRVEFAAAMLADGTVAVDGAVCLLGSFRELHPDERSVADEYAPGARSEADLLRAMADRELPGVGAWTVDAIGDVEGDPRGAELRASRDGGRPVVLYAARSSDPANRPANTADTYRQFADDVALNPADRLLLITTHIYAAYQHMDAIRALGLRYGVAVETVGLPPSLSPRKFTAAWYLQEVRSTIRSARMLLATRGDDVHEAER